MRQVHEMARGSASAFAISSDGIIATNYHVIEEKNGAALGAMDLSGKTYAVTEVLAASKADARHP